MAKTKRRITVTVSQGGSSSSSDQVTFTDGSLLCFSDMLLIHKLGCSEDADMVCSVGDKVVDVHPYRYSRSKCYYFEKASNWVTLRAKSGRTVQVRAVLSENFLVITLDDGIYATVVAPLQGVSIEYK